MNTLVEELKATPWLIDHASSLARGDRIDLEGLYRAWGDGVTRRPLLPDRGLVEAARGDGPVGELLHESYLVRLDPQRWERLRARARPSRGEWIGDRVTFVRGADGFSGLALPDDRFAWPRVSLFVDIGGRRRRIGVREAGGALDISVSAGGHCSLPDADDDCEPGDCRTCELQELDNGDVVCRCTCA